MIWHILISESVSVYGQYAVGLLSVWDWDCRSAVGYDSSIVLMVGFHSVSCRLSIGLKSGNSIPNLTRSDPDMNPTGFTVSSATLSVADSWPMHWKICVFFGFLLVWPVWLGYEDDIIKWKHFPRNWPFVRGNSPVPVNSSHKDQWCGALMFSLICVWINSLVKNHEAGDLRCHRGHYDVNVMCSQQTPHSAPMWATYGVCFVMDNWDVYSASVTIVLCAIPCYIGPHHNSTWLY